MKRSTRGSLIALGLSAGTLLLLYSQRVSSAPAPAPVTPATTTPPPVVTPPPVTQSPQPAGPRQTPEVERARALITKAKRDVASITQDEVNEMRALAAILRVSGYGYEADSIDTLLIIRENFLYFNK